jgi:hypothetical protein
VDFLMHSEVTGTRNALANLGLVCLLLTGLGLSLPRAAG